jgi:D-arabinose 1-dehydrogenase-like Zn-dependent alcohol dehydrogenase
MRAMAITKFNEPWEIKKMPDPRPAAGQVLIRVRASGMCATDIHVHHGFFPLPTPVIAGHEPVGEIVEVGPGVTDLRVGDVVGVNWFQKGDGRCPACMSGHAERCASAQSWMNLGGGNSELMLAWVGGCTILPAGLDAATAAPIFCAGYTVMSGLRNADPKPGERVAVLGMGGLGHLALQFSHALGLETFAITGQAGKKDELTKMGADEVIAGGDDPGKALLGAGGADVILSTTGAGKQVASAFAGLRPGGRFINMGLITDGPIPIDSATLMFGQRQLRGSSQDERSDLWEALQLVASGKVKPVIETYPLEQANEVRDRLQAGKVRYRAVLMHSAS